jgi:hypothetical protein
MLIFVQTPEYCALGDGSVHAVNAWIGPAGTVTPLHTDTYHNIFVQVVGCKYFQLFSPAETSKMYAYESGLTTNSSRVDAAHADDAAFPLFKTAKGLQFFLHAGQALYIPPGRRLCCLHEMCAHLIVCVFDAVDAAESDIACGHDEGAMQDGGTMFEQRRPASLSLSGGREPLVQRSGLQ